MNWSSTNTAESFCLFKQKVELFFIIKNITGEKQVPYILRGVEDEGLRRYNSWTLTDGQRKDPVYIWKCFEEQLEPAENYRVARLKLHYYNQRSDESLDDFVTRCRRQASKCQFTDEEADERILEQIIASTVIPEFQKDLLEQKKGYKLEQALELGRTYEATKQSMQELKTMNGAGSTTTVASVFKKPVCRNCGRNHPREPRNRCPAYNSVCDVCGKTGHWKKVCLTKEQRGSYNRDPQHTRRGRGNGRGQQRRRTPSRFREQRGHSRSPDCRRQNQQQQQHHHIGIEEEFECITFESITTNEKSRDEAFAFVDVNLEKTDNVKYKIKLKVDTGAQGNTLPLRTFRRMFPAKLSPDGFPVEVDSADQVTLTAYNRSSIPCYGSIQVLCKYKDSEWAKTKFFIVDVPGPAVIGLPSCTQLKVVTLHCAVEMKTHKQPDAPLPMINSVADLVHLYPEQFDKIGNFPGTVKLHLKDNVEPSIDAPRKWPIHLKDKIKGELDTMENLNVI